MDNLTHTLTGLMLSRCGVCRGKGTAVMMMLAANTPDIDGISFFRSGLAYLEQHRGYPHALACMPITAILPLLVARVVAGVKITWGAYLACIVGILSHLLLDWTNAYGIR